MVSLFSKLCSLQESHIFSLKNLLKKITYIVSIPCGKKNFQLYRILKTRVKFEGVYLAQCFICFVVFVVVFAPFFHPKMRSKT